MTSRRVTKMNVARNTHWQITLPNLGRLRAGSGYEREACRSSRSGVGCCGSFAVVGRGAGVIWLGAVWSCGLVMVALL
jgi:hypothetical protein